MQENCAFCRPEAHWRENIYETKNFKVRIGIGIVTAGHCMIIPKKHYACMGALPDELDEEYLTLKEKVSKSVKKHFAKPFMKEYGVFGQSVPHAHTHFIPSQSPDYRKVSFMTERIIPATKKYNVLCEPIDLKELKKIYQQEGEYMSYEEDGQLYVLRTKNLKQKNEFKNDISYREFFTNLGLKGIKDWQTMTEADKIEDMKKIEATRIVGEF